MSAKTQGNKMATKTTEPGGPRTSDQAVRARTGKAWKEWFAILDEAGAKKMTHQEIVKFLNSEHDVGSWWQQMVTVTYEQERGLRARHEGPKGYQISVSRTVGVPLANLYRAFATEKSRSCWLDESGLIVRKATANKLMRITWKDGKTSLEVYFYAKGDKTSQVVVQHSKLPDGKTAAKMKTYWGKTLDRLRAALE